MWSSYFGYFFFFFKKKKKRKKVFIYNNDKNTIKCTNKINKILKSHLYRPAPPSPKSRPNTTSETKAWTQSRYLTHFHFISQTKAHKHTINKLYSLLPNKIIVCVLGVLDSLTTEYKGWSVLVTQFISNLNEHFGSMHLNLDACNQSERKCSFNVRF